MKSEIENLAFENQTLKKDLCECTRLLKEYQEKELEIKQRDQDLLQQEEVLNRKLEGKVHQLEEEQEKMKAEQDRMAQIRAAYNSDKRALQERIT